MLYCVYSCINAHVLIHSRTLQKNTHTLTELTHLAEKLHLSPVSPFLLPQWSPSPSPHWNRSHLHWWVELVSARPWSYGSARWRRRTRRCAGSWAGRPGVHLHGFIVVVTMATKAEPIQRKAPVTTRARKLLWWETAQTVCSSQQLISAR